jgi:hypothetical protein
MFGKVLSHYVQYVLHSGKPFGRVQVLEFELKLKTAGTSKMRKHFATLSNCGKILRLAVRNQHGNVLVAKSRTSVS